MARRMGSHVTQALAKGMATSLGVDTVLIRADGTPIAVEGSAAPIQSMDNRIAGVLVLLQDVTKLRKITDS